MAALLVIGIFVVVSAAAVRDYAPRPGERRAFQRAALRARHSLTDWDASYADGRREGPA
ncbi:hypothetical protein [Nocardia sp. BMG51109]|uniref:hypothetical protein n=1 Tax=Nocardia sp. BMG51109 TaxID=1056816 RepID=UPI0012EC3702|nr:hypothetical protein [Nocardia sp. BMG51109]